MSPQRRRWGGSRRIGKNTDVTEFGYAFNVNNGSDAGQEMFLYLRADVMGGRKVRVT